MKRYGANKATEFTRKQINVIFAKAKAGEIKIKKWVIADFYNTADYYGYDDNGIVEERKRHPQGSRSSFSQTIQRRLRSLSTAIQASGSPDSGRRHRAR